MYIIKANRLYADHPCGSSLAGSRFSDGFSDLSIPFWLTKLNKYFCLSVRCVEIIFQHEDLLFSEGFSFAQMNDFAALADNPHDISLFENGGGRRVFDRRLSAFNTNDEALSLVTDARLADGQADEPRAFGNRKLFDIHLIGFLFASFLIGLMVALGNVIVEVQDVIVRPDDDKFVERIEVFVSAGDIDTPFATYNGNDINIALLPEI